MSMTSSEEQKGEWYLIAAAVLSSVFPIVTVLTVASIPPVFAAGVATLIAGVCFVVWVTVRKEWHFLYNTVWKDILCASFLIGVLYYGILFTGLSYTTAGNAAILSLSQIFFAFLILSVLLKLESHTPVHYLGATFMVLGAGIILFPKETFSIDWGGALVIIAMACAPLGNWYAKRATMVVSPHFLMMVRSIIAGTFLLVFSYFFEAQPGALSYQTIALLACSGVFLLGLSKIFWQEAIRRITIAKANAMSAFEPLLTLFFAFLILGDVPTVAQISGFIPIVVGMYLLMKKPVSL